MEIHETWLKCYSEPVYRVNIGALMPAINRKTFNARGEAGEREQTGSIGYMDVVRRLTTVRSSGGSLEDIEVLDISMMEIEPEFRGRLEYLNFLFGRADALAKEWSLAAVIISWIQNPKLQDIIKRGRYGFEWDEWKQRAIKRFNA